MQTNPHQGIEMNETKYDLICSFNFKSRLSQGTIQFMEQFQHVKYSIINMNYALTGSLPPIYFYWSKPFNKSDWNGQGTSLLDKTFCQ